MKRLLFILFLWGSIANATNYYLAPTTGSPAGSDANAGTLASPWFSLNKARSYIAAGDTVFLRGGIYYYTAEQDIEGKSGNSGAHIVIMNYRGENPVITKGTVSTWVQYAGLFIYQCNYMDVIGLEIVGWTQQTSAHLWYGMVVQNCQNFTIQRMNIHHNGFGLSIGDLASSNFSTNISITNCDLHHNSDPYTSYGTNTAWGGADGLSIRTSDPAGVFTVTGCRMYWNSDDGFDSYNGNSYITFDRCWIWYNGYRPGFTPTDANVESAGGNGIGLKLGPPLNDYTSTVKRTVKNCIAARNRGISFDQNAGKIACEIYNNTSYYNAMGFKFKYTINGSVDTTQIAAPHIIKNNISYYNTFGTSPMGEMNRASTVENNNFVKCGTGYWTTCVDITVTDADFASVNVNELETARTSDGSLPTIDFLRLVKGSQLIDAGQDVGIAYSGDAPDLGAFELVSATINAILKSGGKIIKSNGKLIK